MDSVVILNTNINVTSVKEVSNLLQERDSKTIAVCNTNTLVRSYKNSELQNKINWFDIRVPDGFPVAKALSFLTKNKFLRVDGYKLFLQTISDGLEANTRHYFFGNNEETTLEMIKNLKSEFQNVNISGYICPENLSADDLASKYKDKFIKIDADIVWVSLGFPKQELFIDKIFNEISPETNFVGIGGVFDWVAGTKKKAPEWVANIGLEWFVRLIQDPKRLYKRYLIDNTLFIVYFLRQVLFLR